MSNGHSSGFIPKLADNFHNLSAKWIFRIELALHTKAGYLPYWREVWTNLTRRCQNVLFHTSAFKLVVAEGREADSLLLK